MKSSLRGTDYPADLSMLLSNNEKVKFNNYCEYYKIMYVDAFISAVQQENLKMVADSNK